MKVTGSSEVVFAEPPGRNSSHSTGLVWMGGVSGLLMRAFHAFMTTIDSESDRCWQETGSAPEFRVCRSSWEWEGLCQVPAEQQHLSHSDSQPSRRSWHHRETCRVSSSLVYLQLVLMCVMYHCSFLRAWLKSLPWHLIFCLNTVIIM